MPTPPKKTGKKPLTQRMKDFAREYPADCNGAAAARRAGYAVRTARAAACALLKDPRIAKLIKKRIEEREERIDVTVDAVLENLWDVQGRCRQATQVYDKQGNIVPGVWMFDSGGANKSLELCGRHLGMFSDKLDVTITRAAAVDYLARSMALIFEIVKDEKLRDKIAAALHEAAQEPTP